MGRSGGGGAFAFLTGPFTRGWAGLDERRRPRQVDPVMSCSVRLSVFTAPRGAAISCTYYYALARAGPD